MPASRRSDQPPNAIPGGSPEHRSLQARLLGDVQLAVDERPLPLAAWPRRGARSLFLLLLTTPEHRIGRERAVDLLWPDVPGNRVRDTWYQALSTLRRVLEPDLKPRQQSRLLRVDAATVGLNVGFGAWIDVDAFEAKLHRSDTGTAGERRAALRDAAALYRGDLLAAEPAVDWAVARREELYLAWQRAMLQLAALDLDAGEPLASVAALESVAAADPTAEGVHHALIRAYLTAGDRERALRRYERWRRTLWDELGIEPSAEVRDLVSLPGVAASRHEGYRPADTSPLPRVLPPTPASFLIGRDRDLERIEELLWKREVRLLTLTGPGGIGKTRLAIDVAHRFDRDGAHVVFVELAGIATPDLVLPTIALALGLRDADATSLIPVIAEWIGERELLLVLDNFEHVSAAAVDIARLLEACPALTVLVTSRVRLHLSAEQVLAVEPLSLPASPRQSLAALARADAVRLFVQRASAAKSDFVLTAENAEAVAAICVRLDGLPLAIELVAAQVRVLSPRAMLARLDRRLDLLAGGPRDAPDRLRTMRATLEWSVDLLDDGARTALQRFSVFAGGAPLSAAAWMTGTGSDTNTRGRSQGLEPPAVPDELLTLVDHNLLRTAERADGEPRFFMLETIRAFALERLEASGEADDVQRRLTGYLIAFAEAAAPCLRRSAQAAEVERLATELDNVRAALAWALARGEGGLALRLATATFQLWFVRAMPSEGRRWLGEALAAAPNAPPRLRVDALLGASALAFLEDNLAVHAALATESMTVARANDYPFGIAVALFQLGVAAERRRDLIKAAARYEEALALQRAIGEPYWVALLLCSLGDIRLWQEQLDAAAALADESLTHWREIGNDWGIAQGLGTAAAVALRQADHRRAARLYRESLRQWVALGDSRGIAGALAGIAGIAGALGDPHASTRLLSAARATGAGAGVRHLAHHIEFEQILSATRDQLDETAFAEEWTSGEALSLAQAIATAEIMVAELEATPDRSETNGSPVRLRVDADAAWETGIPTNVVPLRRQPQRPRRA